MEIGREARLLLRPGMARLKGLETLRFVMESRLELKEVMRLRRGFLGDDIERMVRWGSQAVAHARHCSCSWVHSSLPRQLPSVLILLQQSESDGGATDGRVRTNASYRAVYDMLIYAEPASSFQQVEDKRCMR